MLASREPHVHATAISHVAIRGLARNYHRQGGAISSPNVYGPIDYVVIEFPADARGEGTAKAIIDLVEQGTIRLYDAAVLRRAADGSGSEIDLATEDGPLAGLAPLAGARSGMLDADDLEAASGVLEPNTTALIIVYENAWAVPFVAAARGEGGQMVASARLSAQQIMDTLDAIDARN